MNNKRFAGTISSLIAFASLYLLILPSSANAWDNGVALTPPMGWNSWNKFGCNVSEDMIKSMADAMITSGMKDSGYQYVVIDDCWQVSRDENGFIVADPQRFPSGMKALADYVHSKGLKFGLYSDAGKKTCAGRPGSQGHEFQDAIQYARWGVDYLKYDWCNTDTRNAQEAYSTMRDALSATKRPIVFSMCEWGTAKPWQWAQDVGNLWRTTGDIQDHWEGKQKWPDGNCCSNGMLDIVDQQAGLEGAAGPGHWNDPDMLEVGNGGMTTLEYRSHFSFWCLLAAPLIAGNDLRSMTPEIQAILTNKEVIAVNQDTLGMQGRRIRKDGDKEVWMKQLKDGSRAVILFNRGKTEAEVSVSWTDLGYPEHVSASVRDLWAGKDLGKMTGKFSAKVASHEALVIRMAP
ncbi:MAG TPA: glycoside hydrolase family 27 protein [Candidatus Dormibacteraeota bacterium]|jgi:alpha-galactosidase|nr:glycoside hydrolase family 27 protein [Candidatus Dormibacteraeota bacterium]